MTSADVKNILLQDPQKGSDLLIEFTRNLADNRSLYKKSVLLKSLLNMSETKDQKNEVLEQMIAFTDSIENVFQNSTITNKQDDSVKNYFLTKGISKRIIIECQNIGKIYQQKNDKIDEFRLHDVNLVLRMGEITGLVGENGNGKTTLLRIIAGDLRPSSGTITYFLNENNIPANDWPHIKKNIAYLPQELQLINGNVIESLRVTAAVHGMKGAQNKLETEYIIHRFGLMDHAYKTWKQLSGGYKLRFSLARLLLRRPKVLILDEPLANLDINTQNLFLNDLRDITKSISSPVSIILSSQHLEEVESVSDNMILLSAGKVLYNGLTSSIGNLRNENTYEFKTTLSKEEVKTRLARYNYHRISHGGFSYLISTRKDIDIITFANRLFNSNIPITYLCDISNSSRNIILKLNES